MTQHHAGPLEKLGCVEESKAYETLTMNKIAIEASTALPECRADNEESTIRQSKDSPIPSFDPMQIATPEQLQAFNFLLHPIWIFDFVKRRNRWANNAGLKLWQASSLEEFLDRDMTEMSPAAEARMRDAQRKIKKGLGVEEQWTIYPKGIPKTVHLTSTGLRLDSNENYFCLLCYAVPIVQENLFKETLRGNEMLQHLPLSVCQFDMNGAILYQNPASAIRLPPENGQETAEEKLTEEESTTETSDDSFPVQETITSSHCPGDSISEDPARCDDEEYQAPNSFASLPSGRNDFLDHFVNPEAALAALNTIQTQDEANVQAKLKTSHGPQWSAIQLRKMKDPLTGKSVILYTSQDKTDAMDAKREREASMHKSEFLAIMAHEIRTPLHQVTGFIDLLSDTPLNKEQSGYAKLLKTSAQGLMTVINDVLDYSKLEAGQMKVESIPYEPLSVLQGSMAAVRASCEEKGLYLTMDWSKKIPFRILGDPNRLRQILLNLLSNAIKFTKEGGIQVDALCINVPNENVVVQGDAHRGSLSSGSDRSRRGSGDGSRGASSKQKSWIKFVVTDTGIGITKKHRQTIFEKYEQGNVSVARHYGGTGLGLSICQLLVSIMGGSIDVESHVGHGSSFWFALSFEEPKEDFFHSEHPFEGSLSEETSCLNILIAEDNRINQKLMTNMMRRLGHEATIADDGKVAIDMIEKGDYDVVFMDIQMPVMDGLEATRRLRSLGYSDLPIYGLTASVKQCDYTEIGFDDWLPKPILMNDLKIKLHRLMKSKAASSSGRAKS